MRGLDLHAPALCLRQSFPLGVSGLETSPRCSRAFSGAPCGGLRDYCLGVEWLPLGAGRQLSRLGEILAATWGGRGEGRGGVLERFTARSLPKRPRPPSCLSVLGL